MSSSPPPKLTADDLRDLAVYLRLRAVAERAGIKDTTLRQALYRRRLTPEQAEALVRALRELIDEIERVIGRDKI